MASFFYVLYDLHAGLETLLGHFWIFMMDFMMDYGLWIYGFSLDI